MAEELLQGSNVIVELLYKRSFQPNHFFCSLINFHLRQRAGCSGEWRSDLRAPCGGADQRPDHWHQRSRRCIRWRVPRYVCSGQRIENIFQNWWNLNSCFTHLNHYLDKIGPETVKGTVNIISSIPPNYESCISDSQRHPSHLYIRNNEIVVFFPKMCYLGHFLSFFCCINPKVTFS